MKVAMSNGYAKMGSYALGYQRGEQEAIRKICQYLRKDRHMALSLVCKFLATRIERGEFRGATTDTVDNDSR